ncbi:MAG TPA: MOSC domain-containing protein [Aestuariivirgaceae bacterium]|nr:MOSC domain-containing protein [Aestuariivirgaceae bacterium]
MRLSRINRYPVKGMSPDALRQAELEPGRGLPFDRAAAFTSGNLPDLPRKGGWVRARTFLQLTVYPELARICTAFDETSRTITLTAPDGAVAQARLGVPDSFAEANALIRQHFAAGPHGPIELHEQAPDRGHWDFTDTVLSVCNLETVRAVEAAAGRPLDPTRFRANLYLEGLGAWEEFGLIGHKLRIGGAELECLRPVMRCAATSVDPERGNADVDVPELLHRSFGHMFLAVYARVSRGGPIACGDAVNDLGSSGRNLGDDLPPGTPQPRQWPRIVQLFPRAGGASLLASPNPAWPLPAASPGSSVRLHPGLAGIASVTVVPVTESGPAGYAVARSGPLAGLPDGTRLILTGPYGSPAAG